MCSVCVQLSIVNRIYTSVCFFQEAWLGEWSICYQSHHALLSTKEQKKNCGVCSQEKYSFTGKEDALILA
jgi:hypothetical protein